MLTYHYIISVVLCKLGYDCCLTAGERLYSQQQPVYEALPCQPQRKVETVIIPVQAIKQTATLIHCQLCVSKRLDATAFKLFIDAPDRAVHAALE